MDRWSAAEAALARLKEGAGNLQVEGLPLSAQAFFLAWMRLREERPAPWFVVAPGRNEAAQLADDLASWLPGVPVHFLPSWETLPFDPEEPDPELIGERQRVFFELLRWDPDSPAAPDIPRKGALGVCRPEAGRPAAPVVVAPLTAALQAAPAPEDFLSASLRLVRGGTLPGNPEALLADLGYERVPQVTGPGEFARRGGIVDVAPPGAPSGPVRVELFGDSIESIRRLDTLTQRSKGDLEEVWILPAREFPASPADRAALAEDLRREGTPFTEAAADLLARTGRFPGWLWYLAARAPRRTSPVDYLPSGGRLVLVEPQALSRRREELAARLAEVRSALRQQGAGERDPEVFFGSLDALFEAHRTGCAFALGQMRQECGGRIPESLPVPARAVPPYGGRFPTFTADLKRWSAGGGRTILWCHNRGEADRLRELLAEAGALSGGVELRLGEVEEGFLLEDPPFWCVPDHDLFRRYRGRRRGWRRRAAGGRPITSFIELVPGAPAVHVDAGICRYGGLVPLEVDGVTREYALLEFAEGEKLYLPADQVGRLQRYVGVSDPPLSRLGGEQWTRAKAKARARAAEAARELLALYAARHAARKRPLPPDTPWQREFEEAFLYEATPGQEKAVREIKRDQQSERPMDRLVCGDVGFGKTEVALRAAFKAVQDRRQVAVLVPTTVLAQQHAATFRERLADWPVRVEMLSRFKSRREQAEILERLRAGEVDVLVGTHRLLQGDVKFASLGLLVVDEEHRFGVRHKERLKALRRDVDVLTLTATPIPRTLHMALSGLRDISVLDTPPRNRRPVHVHVGPYDEALVVEAVRRELAREGQVFYVYNHVHGIENIADRLQGLLPGVRIGIAHGQLTEHELESVMADFGNREIQVLVCTSIVESGLDLPNVNTLIVERSDAFGLPQLYQLKGRVGRTDRQAYAYFFFPPGRTLRENARKRLEALQQLTALGSGLHVAMRDLEIRGAGSLFGVEQHGQVEAVGLEMYGRLLAEETARARGEEPPAERSLELALHVSAHLPADYVPDQGQRLDIYRRLAELSEPAEVHLAGLEEELRDRFGPLPPPARLLLAASGLRARAVRLGLERLELSGGWARLAFAEDASPPPEAVAEWVAQWPPARLRFSPNEPRTVAFRVAKGDEPEEERLTALRDLLAKIETQRRSENREGSSHRSAEGSPQSTP